MVRSQIVAALIVGAASYRRGQIKESALRVEEEVEGGLEEFEFDEEVDSEPLGSCSVVSRRRVFSTTCACRRRSSADANDRGLECIDSAMRCPEGANWDGENCAAIVTSEPDAVAGPTTTTTAAPTRSPDEMSSVVPPAVGAGGPANNPVNEIYMYRAQEFDGETGYAMENVNMADLPGVIQYIHREIIAEHTIGAVDRLTGESRLARKYDISTIMRYRFLVKNPDALSEVQMDFNGYVTFDFGQASNMQQWEDFTEHGDFVGVQQQSNSHVPFNDPYYWFSLSGFCPNLPFTSAAITTLCPEDPTTLSGTCSSKEEVKTFGCRATGDSGMDKCLCYQDGSTVWGGLCGADESRSPPTELSVPTGGRGCTYSYDPQPDHINIDELVGITAEMCNGQPCADWADFRENCDNAQLKRSFTALGGIKRTTYCVEYDLHPDCAQLGCEHPICLGVPEPQRELGLPFWQGRCKERANAARAEAASEAFGVENAASEHIITHPTAPEYANARCNRTSSLECSPNMLFGEGYCTRAWSGICTSCRIAGTEQPTANRDATHCPWSVARGNSEYQWTLDNGRWCKSSLKPSDLCCLYSDSCATKLADVPAMVDTMPLDDDSLALVLATSDTDAIFEFFTRIAKELLSVPDADLEANAIALTEESYWAWGDKPDDKFMEHDVIRLIKAADILLALFPAGTRFTTVPPTTTILTTTQRAWHFITTAAPQAPVVSELPAACQCSETGIVNGVDTHRPGCSAHLGRGYGPFCYIEGGNECPGNIKFSRSLGVHFRRRCT